MPRKERSKLEHLALRKSDGALESDAISPYDADGDERVSDRF